MNFYSFPPLISAFLFFLTGFFVFSRNKKSEVNLAFMLTCLSTFWWQFSWFILFNCHDEKLALFLVKLGYAGIIFIPLTFFHFFINFLNAKKTDNWLVYLSYFFGFIFEIFLWTTSYFISGYHRYFWGFYPKAGLLHPFYFLLLVILSLRAVSLLIYHLKKERSSPLRYNQIKYVLLALIFYFPASSDFIVNYGLEFYPLGFVAILISLGITAYTIARYRLMDITVAITRTTIFVFVYSFVLGIPFIIAKTWRPWLEGIFRANWYLVPLGFLAFLAMVGPSIYLYIQQKAENRLLREQKHYQETLRQASAGMTRIRDLKRLLKLIVYMVRRAVKLTHACIYLFDEKINQYALQAVRDQNRAFVNNLEVGNHLIEYLREFRQPLVYEELKRLSEDERNVSFVLAEAEMKRINASVIVPSFVEDRLLGFIAMGDKLSGKIFTEDDLAVFSVLANQAALAIENAQFYKEVHETQEQLFQAEKMATLGTMADGLSHQINNRFHALGLISGDALDTIKLADTASLSEETKKLLSEIKHALEKVQDNVMQGGEVVKGLLKYSRPGEEGFEPIVLDQIIDASLEMVQYKVKLKELDFVKEYAHDLPKINGNFTQLQEVFFNLIDNAYDAMKQRLDELKEPDYRGKIVVTAQGFDNVLQIKLSDNGIGVKKEDYQKLFTPFFTTKASSRRGTGLGLFVIQKIISNNHKGKISVESEYQKGTTFTIELPFAK